MKQVRQIDKLKRIMFFYLVLIICPVVFTAESKNQSDIINKNTIMSNKNDYSFSRDLINGASNGSGKKILDSMKIYNCILLVHPTQFG